MTDEDEKKFEQLSDALNTITHQRDLAIIKLERAAQALVQIGQLCNYSRPDVMQIRRILRETKF